MYHINFNKVNAITMKGATQSNVSGKKLYAERDDNGRPVDIQTYQLATPDDQKKKHTKSDKKK